MSAVSLIFSHVLNQCFRFANIVYLVQFSFMINFIVPSTLSYVSNPSYSIVVCTSLYSRIVCFL
ncbi:unnamed protein product [Soboliphyme baturini]|uniref:Secreted protein n=1 Tax=Soboliphyme baturini TaxID=241478 RepID=A0A183JBA1_9BILA|nr:unnamed protein product [Soboliphyme baturini]